MIGEKTPGYRIRMVGDFQSPEKYLAHYGIKGQKWGVRRFQNEDQSLTEAGKRRYGIGLFKSRNSVNTSDTNSDRSKENREKNAKNISIRLSKAEKKRKSLMIVYIKHQI